ncbi:HK97-gp10 family putative phage morphogenesis protein [Tsuneonella suprasediminis]|uniref:HK97-gp10 family putative phage morphogenesis protein n=1 Tax=Tsuneonella suprasediminis TaxID=2306996 RepID=UPI002F93D4B6
MKVKFEGSGELEAALRNLGNRVTAKNVAKRALTKAAEPIRDRARSLAPDDPATGMGKFLRDSIKTAPGRRSRGDRVWALVGIDSEVDPVRYVDRKSGRGDYRDPGVAGVAVIMEFGAPANNIPAQPFMRPAWEAEKLSAPERIATELRDEIDKSAARAARKAARSKK